MTPKTIKRNRLIGLFILGVLLFNFPIISIFNVPYYVFTMPILFVYLFIVWVLFIILIMLITRNDPNRGPGITDQ